MPQYPGKGFVDWANTPIIPQSAIGGLQNAITEHSLDESMLGSQLRGFGAGALEGLRGLITPGNIAAAATPLWTGGKIGMTAGKRAIETAAPVVRNALNQAQRQPRMYEVNTMIDQLKNRLGQVPTGSGPHSY